jgi:hypothetical protein
VEAAGAAAGLRGGEGAEREEEDLLDELENKERGLKEWLAKGSEWKCSVLSRVEAHVSLFIFESEQENIKNKKREYCMK